jgi:hypothetical protein
MAAERAPPVGEIDVIARCPGAVAHFLGAGPFG